MGCRQVPTAGATCCSVPDPGISPWDVLGAARVAHTAGPCSSWHPSGKHGGPSHGQTGRSSISAKAKSAQLLLTNDVYWARGEPSPFFILPVGKIKWIVWGKGLWGMWPPCPGSITEETLSVSQVT